MEAKEIISKINLSVILKCFVVKTMQRVITMIDQLALKIHRLDEFEFLQYKMSMNEAEEEKSKTIDL